MLLCRRRIRWRSLCINIFVFIYCALVIFAIFNNSGRCRVEMPTMYSNVVFTNFTEGGKCRVNLNDLGYKKIDIFEKVSIKDIEDENTGVRAGGLWEPSNCKPWQKVAIIIPYRDRWEHLKLLLKRLHPMLQKQKISYQMFVIEQDDDDKFNRGRLLNIGVAEALKQQKFDCFVFQDVDLLPENDKNIYYCNENVRHLAAAIDEMRYHVMYYNYAGGVVAVNRENLLFINGYANDYWGWGKEDDDFSARTMGAGLSLSRPPEHIGRYKMVRHHKAWQAEGGYDLFMTWQSRWRDDGLNNVHKKYQTVELDRQKLYTRILVNIGKPPTEPPVDKTADKVSLVWFLTFFFP